MLCCFDHSLEESVGAAPQGLKESSHSGFFCSSSCVPVTNLPTFSTCYWCFSLKVFSDMSVKLETSFWMRKHNTHDLLTSEPHCSCTFYIGCVRPNCHQIK